MAEQLAYLAACMVAVLFSYGFPAGERRAANLVAVALLGDWIVCQWTYAPLSPYALVSIHGRDVWSIADLAFGITAFMVGWCEQDGRPHRWALALWFCSVAQCCFHVVRDTGFIAPGAYLWWLDKLLQAQIAVFVVGGGGRVVDRVARHFGSRWHAGRARLATHGA